MTELKFPLRLPVEEDHPLIQEIAQAMGLALGPVCKKICQGVEKAEFHFSKKWSFPCKHYIFTGMEVWMFVLEWRDEHAWLHHPKVGPMVLPEGPYSICFQDPALPWERNKRTYRGP